MENEKKHIVEYRTYFLVLIALLVFTFSSIGVTSLDLGALSVTAALVFSSIKSLLVFAIFMHLKFDNKIYAIMVGIVLFIFTALVVITFLDYIFR
jgi:cytochrome c oxidase subunit IV